MRTRLVTFLALVAVAPPALAFEGAMDVKMSVQRPAKGEAADKDDASNPLAGGGTGKIYLGKPGVRMLWQMGKGEKQVKMSTLMLRAKPGMVYLVNDEARTYSELDTSKNSQHGADDKKDEKVTVKRLGNEKVAGYDCAHGIVTSGEDEVEVWTSRDVGDMTEFFATQESREHHWDRTYQALKGAGMQGWPMKWADRRPDRGSMTWEVTHVSKGSPPAAMFDLSGYKKSASGFGAIQLSAEQKKQMEDAMKKLTPEQRKQMEKMMRGEQ